MIQKSFGERLKVEGGHVTLRGESGHHTFRTSSRLCYRSSLAHIIWQLNAVIGSRWKIVYIL